MAWHNPYMFMKLQDIKNEGKELTKSVNKSKESITIRARVAQTLLALAHKLDPALKEPPRPKVSKLIKT